MSDDYNLNTIEVENYTILDEIGVGGSSVVYKAIQDRLARYVAVKYLKTPLANLNETAQLFASEGMILASLQHPNIVNIHDSNVIGQQYYIVMEWIQGPDLTSRIRRQDIDELEALEIVEKMADCLAYAHDKGIVHRDLKPSQILFREDMTPVLTDFGIAKTSGTPAEESINDGHTKIRLAPGSPHYMSPEQIMNQTIDGRSDIYSLGVTFYEMLTGEKPYDSASTFQVLNHHVESEIPQLPLKYQRYQPVLNRMMEKNKMERLTADEVLTSIRSHIAGIIDKGAVLRTSSWVGNVAASAAIVTFLGAAFAFGNVYFNSDDDTAFLSTQSATIDESLTDEDTNSEPITEEYETPDPVSNNTFVAQTTQIETSSQDPIEQIPVDAPQTIIEVTPVIADQWVILSPSDDIDIGDIDDDEAVPSEFEINNSSQNNADALLFDERSQLKHMLTQKNEPRKKRVNALLRLADISLQEWKLTTPKRDSAYYYFNRVLSANPNNQRAQRGIRKIAQSYTQLAENIMEKGKFNKALEYVNRGLAIEPANEQLKTLKAILVSI